MYFLIFFNPKPNRALKPLKNSTLMLIDEIRLAISLLVTFILIFLLLVASTHYEADPSRVLSVIVRIKEIFTILA